MARRTKTLEEVRCRAHAEIAVAEALAVDDELVHLRDATARMAGELRELLARAVRAGVDPRAALRVVIDVALESIAPPKE